VTLADTERADDGGTEPEPAHRPRGTLPQRFWRRFPRAKIMLVLAVLAILLNGLTVHKVTQVSPIDERDWMDFLVKAAHFQVDQGGDILSQETLRELCERGATFTAFPPCTPGKPLNPKKFGYKGVNISGHSPFYFWITAPVARVLRATPINLPPNDSLVTWGRLLGTVWLLVGVYFTLRIGDLFEVDRTMLAIALVLLIASPALLHANTIINPDVCAFPAGAGVLWAAVAWEKRRCRLWVVALAAILAAALDPTNSVGVLVAILYLGIRAIATASWNVRDRARGTKEPGPRSLAWYSAAAAALVGGAFIANRGWDRLYTWLTIHVLPRPDVVNLAGNPINKAYSLHGAGIPIADFFKANTLFTMIPPMADVAPPSVRTGTAYFSFEMAAILLVTALIIGSALRARMNSPVQVLSVATLVTLIISGPLLVLYNYWTGGTFDSPVPRYGLSALPAIAVVIAAACTNRTTKWVVGLVAAGLYASAVVALLL
jgi:hypothetical protein